MALHYKTKGFVFKKEDRADADRVFSVFTRDFGRVEIFAKAIRKISSKLKGGIEIFSLSDLEFIQGKNRKTLTDAIFIQKPENIIKDPEKIKIAGRACGMLDAFIKGQELDEKIWEVILDFFEKLNNCPQKTIDSQPIHFYFFWNFISALGYAPQLSACATCQKPLDQNDLYFSHKQGGIINGACAVVDTNAQKINPDVVKMLRLFLKKDWQTICRLKTNFVSLALFEDVSNNHYTYLVESVSL